MQEQHRSLFGRVFKRGAPGGDAARRSAKPLSAIAADLPERDRERMRSWIDNCLAGIGGPVAARAQAIALGHAYVQLSEAGRMRFLELLSVDYGIDEAEVERAIAGWRESELEQRPETAQKLRYALEPAHTTLLRQFNGVPAGVKFLVDIRAELLTFANTNAALRPLETGLKQLLATWCDIGVL